MIDEKLKRLADHLFHIAAGQRDPRLRTRHAAAVLDKKGRILGIGLNRLKSHPLQQRYSKNPHAIFLHAEIDAIRNARRIASADEMFELVVVRVRGHRNNLEYGNSRPCSGCANALEAFGIRFVTWSGDGNSGFVRMKLQ